MLAKRIIPCLDVNAGRVVKGIQFENLRDAGDPVELARTYVRERADELVFLDISASKESRRMVFDLVERLSEEVFIPFTIGGGLRTLEDVREILVRGADKVALNTAAVLEPELISRVADAFGSQCVVVAIDVKRQSPKHWGVYTHGGSEPTQLDALQWVLEVERLGAGEILLTSMDRDGGGEGFDLEITGQVSHSVGIPVIASGGVGQKEHFLEVFQEAKADAALAASVFHYGTLRIQEVKQFLAERNIPVRP